MSPFFSTLPHHGDFHARRAFALIIALALMSFVFLLMISLSSLITVESRTVTNVINQSKARANALLALKVAMGELQKYAGPDQRITGTAALLDTDPSTASVDGVDEPYWTGVWDTDGNLLTWLVSGNEGQAPSDGDFARPDNRPANTWSMVEDGSVTVPLTDLNSGKYAYWVSDEGVKAKVNLPDAGGALDPLVSAQAMDITRMTGLDWLSNVVGQKEDRLRLTAPDSLKIFASDATSRDSIESLRHDLTAHSYGLLTNTADGGLKQDLTLALYDNSQMPAGQIFGPITGAGSIQDPGGPTWLQLQSWVNIPTTGDLEARPQNDDQTGISPVITMAQYYVVPRTVVDAAAGTQDIYLDIYPAVTLWNPYDRPLQIDDGKIDIQRQFMYSTTLGGAGSFQWNYSTLHALELKVYKDATTDDFTRYNDSTTPKFPASLPTTMHFSLGSFELAPGESITFTPPSGTADEMTLKWANFNYYPLTAKNNYDADAHYYIKTPTRLPYPYDSANPANAIPYATLAANTASNHSFRLLDGDNLLQEIYNLSGFTNYTAARTQLTPEGATTLDGSVGLKIYRVFTDTTGDSGENRAAQWLSHLNPRGASQGAIPYAFYFSKQIVEESAQSHNNNPSFYSTSRINGDERNTGLINTGNGLSFDSASVDETVLFESVLGRRELQSIGQLMHAPLFYSGANRSGGTFTNLTAAEADASDRVRYGRMDNTIPAYAIGNSEADPSIALDALAVEWVASSYTDPSNNYYTARYCMVEGHHYDYSYLLNEKLWDGYFFSSLPGGTSRQPANPRIVARDATQATRLDSKEVAAEFLVDGAFNVNSTSEEAWRALLGAFFGQAIIDTESASPFVRVNDGSGNLLDPANDDYEDEVAYHGYRALTQDQIVNLAHQIVKQIKWRRFGRDAPFTSMADLVNRDPYHDAPAELGADAFRLRGTLSAALRAADEINDAEAGELGIDDPVTAQINAVLKDHTTTTDTSAVISGFTTEAMEGWRSEGIPGWLTQADLLARLGPVLTVRSDTFKIRVYGEARDPFTDDVTGRAWGEAIVQRLPEFIDSTADAATADVGSLNSLENTTFGRRFVVVSFRWLNES